MLFLSSRHLKCVVISLAAVVSCAFSESDGFLYGQFPDGFAWGVATAAYQVEGGWNADGKDPSIWDTWCHNISRCSGANGDVACDSYHLWQRDIEMLKELNVTHYRFSLSWTRLLPQGTPDKPNPAGIAYYNNLINGLLASNIVPVVTLFHWDLPLVFQQSNVDGWLNESIIERFANYTRFCFATFGDRVKLWITINEPLSIVAAGYALGTFPPGMTPTAATGFGAYMYAAAHNILRAHARGVDVYRKEFQQKQNGTIGIVLSGAFSQPASTSPEDKEAAERQMIFEIGWFASPVFTGDYPPLMKERIAARDKLILHLNKTRLPEFTAAEKDLLKGSVDFIGANVYGAQLIANNPKSLMDSGNNVTYDPNWIPSSFDWLYFTPWSMRGILNWYKRTYANSTVKVPFYITESGFADNNGSLKDSWRVNYYRAYTNELLKAIRIDGIDVKGYTAWSIMDNLEWASGYTQKFGLYFVDFNSPNRTRKMKDSAWFYKKLIEQNGFSAGSTEKVNILAAATLIGLGALSRFWL